MCDTHPRFPALRSPFIGHSGASSRKSAVTAKNATVYAASCLSAAPVPTNAPGPAIRLASVTLNASARVRMAAADRLTSVWALARWGAREGLRGKRWVPDLRSPSPHSAIHADARRCPLTARELSADEASGRAPHGLPLPSPGAAHRRRQPRLEGAPGVRGLEPRGMHSQGIE